MTLGDFLEHVPTLLDERFGVDGTALWVTCLPYAAYIAGSVAGGALGARAPPGEAAVVVRRRLVAAGFGLGAVALLLFVAALAAGVWCLADDDAPGDKARKWA